MAAKSLISSQNDDLMNAGRTPKKLRMELPYIYRCFYLLKIILGTGVRSFIFLLFRLDKMLPIKDVENRYILISLFLVGLVS